MLFTVLESQLTMPQTEMEHNGLTGTVLQQLISEGHLQWTLETVPSVRFYHELHHHLLHEGLTQREIGRICRGVGFVSACSQS